MKQQSSACAMPMTFVMAISLAGLGYISAVEAASCKLVLA
jgi:hypothetical protein